MHRNFGIVEKGWGSEEIWVTNEYYCSKFLHFNKDARFSMHFHARKIETWYFMSGRFLVEWIDTKTGAILKNTFLPKDIKHIDRLVPHRITCLEKGTILEVSSADSVDDNYRVMPGDSQSALHI